MVGGMGCSGAFCGALCEGWVVDCLRIVVDLQPVGVLGQIPSAVVLLCALESSNFSINECLCCILPVEVVPCACVYS